MTVSSTFFSLSSFLSFFLSFWPGGFDWQTHRLKRRRKKKDCYAYIRHTTCSCSFCDYDQFISSIQGESFITTCQLRHTKKALRITTYFWKMLLLTAVMLKKKKENGWEWTGKMYVAISHIFLFDFYDYHLSRCKETRYIEYVYRKTNGLTIKNGIMQWRIYVFFLNRI